MSKWTIRYTNTAFAELDCIYKYIAEELLVPEISMGQIRRIMKAIAALDEMPLRNTLYDKEPWKSRGLRKLPVDNYMVFYYANEQTSEVVIMHIFYGGRNIADILNNEAAEQNDSGNE